MSFKETTVYKVVYIAASTSAGITSGAIVGALCPPAGLVLSAIYGIGSGVLGTYVGDKAGQCYADVLAETVDSMKKPSNN